MKDPLFRLPKSGDVDACGTLALAFFLILSCGATAILGIWYLVTQLFHAKNKPRKSSAWDPEKPCTFVLWHRRLNKRVRVVGYSLHGFCDSQKWSYSEVVGSFVSNQVEPKGFSFYESPQSSQTIPTVSPNP